MSAMVLYEKLFFALCSDMTAKNEEMCYLGKAPTATGPVSVCVVAVT